MGEPRVRATNEASDMLKKKTLTCRADPRYTVVLDPAEAFPEDPGQGTPSMLYGPDDTSATFFCALDTGEIDGTQEIPSNVYRWLEFISDEVDEFVGRAFDEARTRDREAAHANARALWVRTLCVGSEVWWADPDGGQSSGTYTITTIHGEGRNTTDTIVRMKNAAGSEAEAPIGELGDPSDPESKNIVRFGSDGQPVVYEDAADASEHLLRMQEGLC